MQVVLAQSVTTVTDKVGQLVEAFLGSVPLLALGLATALVGLLVARIVADAIRSGMRRSGAGTIGGVGVAVGAGWPVLAATAAGVWRWGPGGRCWLPRPRGQPRPT